SLLFSRSPAYHCYTLFPYTTLFRSIASTGEDILYSESLACAFCGISLPEIEPRTFSFNTPHGACPTCQGLGVQLELDPELLVPNPDLTLREGPFEASGWSSWEEGGYYRQLVEAVAQEFGISMDTPWRDLPE